MTDMDAQRIATVRHPVGAGAVSLRVRATDVEGNSIEQTIIRAHGLYRAFSTKTPRPMR